jgi:hypothetical protein
METYKNNNMKKLIFAICFLAATNLQAQKIDTVRNATLVKPIVLNALKKDTLYQFTVDVFGVKLKDTTSGANSFVQFYDRKGKPIYSENYPLTAQVVKNWGTDDTSVVEYLLKLIGLVKR